MNIKEAKAFFDHGVICQFRADPEPMGKGWVLVFIKKSGGDETFETALGRVRVFSSLDTLASQVEQITGRVSGCNFSI